RIKQLVGWQVALRPDGTVQWVDPLGRRYLTRALDHRGRPQTPPTPTPAAPARSLEQQTADQAAREKSIAHALHKEGPVSILEEHLSHDLFDLDQEANRHAIRTGTPRPWREQVPFDIRYHDRAHHHLAGRVTEGTAAGSTGPRSDPSGACKPAERGQPRQILIDVPSPTGAEQSHRPRRVEYDEPPF
ncbi:MAG TPA: hypothetical protein PLA46_09230, partial [Phycicoccus sp.]|nr:hypothetical protein [Phycicoccus sp.]